MAWAPDYATADELATFSRVDDDIDDVQYAMFISMGSRAIDHATNRQFGTVTEARFYTPRWSFTRSAWEIETDDFTAITAVDVDVVGDDTFSTPIALSGVRKDPIDAQKENRPFERIRLRTAVLPTGPTYPHDSVRVTGTFGWSAVPLEIKGAALLQGSRFAARRDSPYGIAGSPNEGSELRLLAKADPDVIVALKDFVRRVLP